MIVGRIEKNKVVEFDHFKKIHILLKIIYNKSSKLYNAKKLAISDKLFDRVTTSILTKTK